KWNPARALKLIEQALEDYPDVALYLNTLGVVQYRNGQYKQALVTLEKSLAAGQGQSDAFDLFFLAMSYQQLGDAGRARACYHRALAWVQGHKDLPAAHAEELRAFQAEAQALLRPTR